MNSQIAKIILIIAFVLFIVGIVAGVVAVRNRKDDQTATQKTPTPKGTPTVTTPQATPVPSDTTQTPTPTQSDQTPGELAKPRITVKEKDKYYTHIEVRENIEITSESSAKAWSSTSASAYAEAYTE